MKLPKNILIEKACSGDASRPVLNSVYLERMEDGRSRLLATNGRIAAIVPVLCEEGDASGYITADALKAARKAAGKLETASFTANGVCKMPDGQEFARPDLGKYPNVNQVIPKNETAFTVRLDPELLYRLAESIGASRGVSLEIIVDTAMPNANHAIRVRPLDNPRAETAKGSHAGYAPACMDAMGLIMPIATPNT
jgi:hypothetical protein